jgi:hypothetical protein
MGKRWPPGNVFALRDLATLAKVRNARGEWIGVYQGPGPGGPLVGTSRLPRALARRLKRVSLRWPVFVRRAPSRGELPMRIKSDKPDHFMVQMQQAYAAVGRAWNITRNSIGYYSDAEVKRAKDFLCGLRNACRSEGKPRGDRAQADENQRMLDVFLKLSVDKNLKTVAIRMVGPDHFEKRLRSLHVLTRRFSRKVYAEVCSQYGVVSEGFLRHQDSWGYLSSFFGSIKGWPGVKSNSRAHGYALCEALRYYKPTEADLLEFRRSRGYLAQTGSFPQET